MRRLVRSAAVPVLSLAIGACDTNLAEPAAEWAPITNGTSRPQITALTPGQELAIGFIATSTGAVFCSGTVIRNDAVLTAYHCVDDVQPGAIRFGVGDPFSPRLIKVSKIERANWETDLALLRLSADATSIPGLTPIAVNRNELDAFYIGDEVEIAGYAPIDDDHERRYGVVSITNVHDSGITVNGYGQSGPCQGDSGGPLLMTEASGRIVVAGTAIGGDISCRDEAYYSRVDLNLDWLDETLAGFTAAGAPPVVTEASLDPWGCGEGSCGIASTPSLFALAFLGWRRRGIR